MTIHCFYRCDCPDGYKGRNCTEKEYCYWFVCPNGSECVSLIDGHECVSNATFNGVNSTVVVRPNDGGNLSDATITATFRTQRNGTLLHILGSDNSFIRLSVQGKKVVIEVPEKDSTSVTSVFGRRANDGKWHTVSLTLMIWFVVKEIYYPTPKHDVGYGQILFLTHRGKHSLRGERCFSSSQNVKPQTLKSYYVVSVSRSSSDFSAAFWRLTWIARVRSNCRWTCRSTWTTSSPRPKSSSEQVTDTTSDHEINTNSDQLPVSERSFHRFRRLTLTFILPDRTEIISEAVSEKSESEEFLFRFSMTLNW